MISLMASLFVLLGAIWVTRGSGKFMDWATANIESPIVGLSSFAAVCTVVVFTWLLVVVLIARGLSASFGL